MNQTSTVLNSSEGAFPEGKLDFPADILADNVEAFGGCFQANVVTT